MTMNTKEKAEIWKEYFEKLLNKIEPKKFLKIGNREINEVELEELTIEDVKKAMRNLKNNKATGTDGIHPELIKYIGNKLLKRIYELVRQIGRRKAYLKNGKKQKQFLFTKKGDRDKCENYSGIALGNAAYKILSNIILEKITPYIEKITRDYQNGFRDGRSVIDNISTLKIINEKMWEYNQSVQYLFIDFQKAYDFIHTDTLWKCMYEIVLVHCTYTILPVTQVILLYVWHFPLQSIYILFIYVLYYYCISH